MHSKPNTSSPAATGLRLECVALAPLIGARSGLLPRCCGAGEVRLFSAVPLGSDSGHPEIDSGALHRYLAESPWYPTALLPGAGVEWTVIDERRACATLCDRGLRVALEFRFNDAGEVSGIFTPAAGAASADTTGSNMGRPFQHYAAPACVLHGEVGWYGQAGWSAVWRGSLDRTVYDPA